MRVFVGIELSADARAALSTVLADVDIPGKPTPPANWHITLRYLGSVDEVTLDRLIGGLDEAHLTASFVVRTTGLGAFPGPDRATVLWVGLGSGLLDDLADAVEEVVDGIGRGREERPFVGHVTLARIRPPVDVGRLIESIDLPPIAIPVERVTVFESKQGSGHPRYVPIERIDL
jgi:2'-5' RNA ligase